MKKIYNVYRIPFNDKEHFEPSLVATCGNYQMAQAIVSLNNHGIHGYEIVAKEVF